MLADRSRKSDQYIVICHSKSQPDVLNSGAHASLRQTDTQRQKTLTHFSRNNYLQHTDVPSPPPLNNYLRRFLQMQNGP